MRLETFSYLPKLSVDEIGAQIRSILDRELVVAIEHSPRVDPRDHYWTLWGLPLFAVRDPAAVLGEIDACVRAHPDEYVRVDGYDARRQGQVASFVVHRPGQED
ncbi:MAG TPA: ribulose bisphosphate carboxylase small subunit [Gaiellaceae bacterium]|nr:ribulose bisphosphate carboxylase small subunit [Gaiellaceae bacterium]